MTQNSFVLDEIDREATKVRAYAHLQKNLPGKGIPLKTTQVFLLGVIFSYFKAYWREFIFPVSKIF